MAIVAFDIEISNVIDLKPGEDLDRHGPFDISVAGTCAVGAGVGSRAGVGAGVGAKERLWMTRGADGAPAMAMSRDDARALLAYLHDAQSRGDQVVAWNGLSFDLRWIGHVADDVTLARTVALRLYDPMYQFFKLKGFPVGLAKVAEGLGLRTTKLMNGADAPVQWRAGNHKLVCDYVLGDARLTAQVVERIIARGGVQWITQRGSASFVKFTRLRPVGECLRDPMPDQSWMDAPIRDERFTGWLRV